MTTPAERTRAVRTAGELLRDMAGREDVPEDIRARVLRVLRHFPEEWELQMLAEEWQRLGAASFGLAPEPDRPDPIRRRLKSSNEPQPRHSGTV